MENLISALKSGSPIRVRLRVDGNFGLIEFAQPIFTTVIFAEDYTGVVAQFPLSFIQTSYTDPDEAFLATKPPTSWRALTSTEGIYHQFHYNLKTGEIIRTMLIRTQVSWFALISDDQLDQNLNYDLTPENFRLIKNKSFD